MKINIAKEDALQFTTDVLVVKFARALYGLDYQIVKTLFGDCYEVKVNIPEGESQLVDTQYKMGAKQVLFLGVRQLYDFDYPDIRQFTSQALQILSQKAPDIRHVSLTIHGVGYGLEAPKSFVSELAGIQDALLNNKIPEKLETITIIERDYYRAKTLEQILSQLLPDGELNIDTKQLDIKTNLLDMSGLNDPELEQK